MSFFYISSPLKLVTALRKVPFSHRYQLAANGAEAVFNLLLPARKKCPHLGCTLRWNKSEHTWDCPCHGSRFSEDGKLLDNPANGNLSD